MFEKEQKYPLVPYDKEWGYRYGSTTWELFYCELLARYSSQLDQGSILQWIDFPLSQAVATGLWLVTVKLAKQHNYPMRNSEQCRQMLERTNRLVTAGLKLSYVDTKEAAINFETMVSIPILKAVQQGWRPEQAIPLAVWNKIVAGKAVEVNTVSVDSDPFLNSFIGNPAALFFARLVKKTREEVERVLPGLNILISKNRALEGLGYVDSSDFAEMQRVIEYFLLKLDYRIFIHKTAMSEIKEKLAIDLEMSSTLIANLNRRLDQLELQQEICQKLPVETKSLRKKSRYLVEHTNVYWHWINTQLLKITTGTRGEFVTYKGYLKGVGKLVKSNGQEVVIRLLDKWESQGMRLKPEQKREVKKWLLIRISQLQEGKISFRRFSYDGQWPNFFDSEYLALTMRFNDQDNYKGGFFSKVEEKIELERRIHLQWIKESCSDPQEYEDRVRRYYQGVFEEDKEVDD